MNPCWERDHWSSCFILTSLEYSCKEAFSILIFESQLSVSGMKGDCDPSLGMWFAYT